MATYPVEITDANALDRKDDDPRYLAFFLDYLTTNGVVFDAGGGASINWSYHDPDTGELADNPVAIIDATADPTTTVLAYDWDYDPTPDVGSEDFDSDLIVAMQAVLDDGAPDVTTLSNGLKALMEALAIPGLDFS